MSRDTIAIVRTGFEPSQHGFHFSNTQINWRYSGFNGRFLCGGMSYASLDYFSHSLPIPNDTTPPAPRTPLNDYILGRQIHAHQFMIRTLPIKSLDSANNLFHHGYSLDHDFGRVVNWIDTRRPVPILMMDVDNPLSTSSHWTVAIGYELDEVAPGSLQSQQSGRVCGKLMLYDNNFPNVVSYLTPNFTQQWFDHSRGARYRTFWPNSEFRPYNPRHQPRQTPRRSSSDFTF